MPAEWRIERCGGDAGEFHARPLAATRSATFFTADAPTLVLGSTQSTSTVDVDEAARRNIVVVRRRSGGAGVLLIPGEHLWLDMEIPANDPLWSDDVGRAAWWVGELWSEVLDDHAGGVTVHRGRLIGDPWSAAVCFAGTGAGEVVDGNGAKLVGLSQRRTRVAARFQTLVHLRWRPETVAALVAEPRPREPLPDVAVTGLDIDELVERLSDALARR